MVTIRFASGDSFLLWSSTLKRNSYFYSTNWFYFPKIALLHFNFIIFVAFLELTTSLSWPVLLCAQQSAHHVHVLKLAPLWCTLYLLLCSQCCQSKRLLAPQRVCSNCSKIPFKLYRNHLALQWTFEGKVSSKWRNITTGVMFWSTNWEIFFQPNSQSVSVY